jgi:quercetin dioxygenase-like cupin family protein
LLSPLNFIEVNDVKLFHYTDVEPKDAEGGVYKVRWLITKEMGAKNFAMRLFEMEPGGYSPHHSHPWEHEVYILQGEGLVKGGSEERKFKEGDVIFLAANEKHQFKNNGEKTVKFLCMIPYTE